MYSSLLQGAETNMLVMQLNVPSAKNAERFVGALRRMGIESAKICTVVNRFVKKGNDIEPQEIERSLGIKVSWLIPNDFKNAMASINFGEPVVLRAPQERNQRRAWCSWPDCCPPSRTRASDRRVRNGAVSGDEPHGVVMGLFSGKPGSSGSQ